MARGSHKRQQGRWCKRWHFETAAQDAGARCHKEMVAKEMIAQVGNMRGGSVRHQGKMAAIGGSMRCSGKQQREMAARDGNTIWQG